MLFHAACGHNLDWCYCVYVEAIYVASWLLSNIKVRLKQFL